MIVFNSDLDNTLIYSYKHNIGMQKQCVEVYQNREISFMTLKSYEMLKKVNDSVVFVPTTTRTIEQYNRINLGIGIPKYALVCNGGILLKDGFIDEKWYKESVMNISDCKAELELTVHILENDINRCFEIRNIENLFIFTKSSKPDQTVELLRDALDGNKLHVFNNGIKVYALPKKLNKGNTVIRLKEKLGADLVVAAGDSEFDVSMLNLADIAFAPCGLQRIANICGNIKWIDEKYIFSDKILEFMVNKVI